MKNHQARRRRNNQTKGNDTKLRMSPGIVLSDEQLACRQKYFAIFAASVLFAFGVYHSILYFGHQVVPNSDFPGFTSVGRELCSFKLPTSYKRAPVLGMLQVIISWFVGGQYPELTAGRLLNAILHPCSIVLVWLIGRQIIGKAAIWVALVSAVNPWLLQSLTDPIAETTLLFFVLLSTYLILRRSKWVYLAASLTTMVRYEGAALIFIAFVIDMMKGENKKDRILSFVYAVLASVPLGLWMLGTVLSFKGAGSTHYLKELGEGGQKWPSAVKFISTNWQVGFYPLFTGTSQGAMAFIGAVSKFAAAFGFISGVIFCFIKRQWKVCVLLTFLVLYLLVHVMHSFVLHRFCTTVNWIVLFVCVYGYQCIWNLVNKNDRIPKPITMLTQALLVICAIVWISQLLGDIGRLDVYSRRSASIPWVGMAVSIAILCGSVLFFKYKGAPAAITVTAVVCLIFASNQFMLVRIVGNGDRDAEFKYLADWYIENASKGEKMLTTMSGVVAIFAPEHQAGFIHTGGLKSDNPEEFIKKCYEQDITYLAWDSRLGYGAGSRYYKLYKLESIAFLVKPQNAGPFEFIKQIRFNDRRFINIFRLKKPPPNMNR